ncbi:MAG: hypothetical protein GY811_02930 [Myxococcales bacterium]|nr:hypothetical protein [Myxococcales bacterium]
MALLRVVLIAALVSVVACLAQSPQESEPAVQGDYEDGDEEHRPGQPCLLCHSSDGHFPSAPGEAVLEVAGTVFGQVNSDEKDGLRDVEIIFTDARGDEFTALSNKAGNFFVKVDSGLSATSQEGDGELNIPRKPLFPLEVMIRRGGDEQRMKTKIWRNGSCAHCHGPVPGADSVGRVYLFEGGDAQ